MKKTAAILLFFILSVFFCVSTVVATDITVFGPEKFVRGKGKTNLFIKSFSAAEDEARLVIRNGDQDGKNRVSSATVSLNGIEIFKTRDFNQQVDIIEAPISLFMDNSISVELNSVPESFLTIQVLQESAFTIAITSPANNEVINKPYVMVKGTTESPDGGEIGVTVNGYSAQVAGGEFFVNNVGLAEGDNILTAVATDSSGDSVSTEVTVYYEPDALTDWIKLTVNPDNGISPLEATFTIETSFDSTISSSELSCIGPGTPIITQDALTEYSAQFILEGPYICTATITDSQSNFFQDSIGINVLSREAVDALLQAKWQGMTGALAQGDIGTTVSFFSTDSQNTYYEQFSALVPLLNEIAAEFNSVELILVEIFDDKATYEVITEREGVTYSFNLFFMKDSDGIWRIWRF